MRISGTDFVLRVPVLRFKLSGKGFRVQGLEFEFRGLGVGVLTSSLTRVKAESEQREGRE